ncbi:glutathionylspermidine synthase family protein [Hydrogenimonas cancrithermarum]|uniref:Glutathionylspermidine synthase n=1 Tax=Hydrogenimonas cancrithermarum TaxID=2993563 RepID=A0ABM8FJX8_9BACT|nr:glutathionylspermidine synthase family protein [Hydrogenimonas cancrithermarum]BDY12601.1 glutathionylspermidine synthase [Hydrogenimonas cancrithermarum]
MVALKKLRALTPEFLDSIGFHWHTDRDETPYIADEAVVVTEAEAEAYYEAVNELYNMYVEAGEYVVENNLFHEIGIPFNLVDAVKKSWENDVHWHIYGRFDLAGGIGGVPIKLLEFNADTPTALFETAIVQWALLKANGLDEVAQFNSVYEAIRENFKRLIVLDGDLNDFERYYRGWKILFSSIRGNIEDENTTKLLQKMADDAGFHTAFAYVDEVEFGDEEGIFFKEEQYEYWFKLIPWEAIAVEESDLARILTKIMENQKAIILNPAYTLMFQSKAMLKILWDLYPNHPLLLETSFEPLGKKQVQKPFFGREGGSVKILDADGNVITAAEDTYGDQPSVYQAYTELPKDENGRSYQAGVFFAYEGCGLGYRRGGEILDNMSKFVSHIIEPGMS